MGCGNSKKQRNTRKKTEEGIARKETRGTRTPRVLNNWADEQPLPPPYPQGNKDLTKLMKAESMQQGTVYDPNPELITYEVQGEYVPVKQFYSITPVQPIKGVSEVRQVDDEKYYHDTNADKREDRQRDVLMA